MISHSNRRRVRIDITVYEKERDIAAECEEIMTDFNEKSCRNNPKFICSICLNTKRDDTNTVENRKRKARSCPVCPVTCDSSEGSSNIMKHRSVQTQEIDLAHNFSLLNEVLSELRTKKGLCKENCSKTTVCKDACVSTDNSFRLVNSKAKLTVSKTIHFSIDNTRQDSCFVVLDSCQPAFDRSSLNLSKHKSSSIPQMKMEEIKNSMKPKQKSKDTIEEVNRMFATVRHTEEKQDSNRPAVRSGPRVLPVAKTNHHISSEENNKTMSSDGNISDNSKRLNNKMKCGKCGPCVSNLSEDVNNQSMSCGDCLGRKNNEDFIVKRCEKCVYTLCCNHEMYQRHIFICDCCGNESRVVK